MIIADAQPLHDTERRQPDVVASCRARPYAAPSGTLRGDREREAIACLPFHVDPESQMISFRRDTCSRRSAIVKSFSLICSSLCSSRSSSSCFATLQSSRFRLVSSAYSLRSLIFASFSVISVSMDLIYRMMRDVGWVAMPRLEGSDCGATLSAREK